MLDNEKRLEMAKTFGQPVDPERSIPKVVEAVAEVDYAEPNEHDYYFDVLAETKEVVTMDSAGQIVQLHVSPDTESALSFSDLATKEYYVKLHELAANSENVIARKRKTIARAMNREEVYRVINVIDTCATSAGNTTTLTSSESAFTFGNLLTMVSQVKDYGTSLKLITGTTVDNDIDAMEYNENKYHSVMEQLKSLGIERMRVPFSVSRAAQSASTASFASTAVVDATKAYLVAVDTEIGKPVLFVRRRINAINLLGGLITVDGEEAPERVVIVNPNPVVAGAVKYLGIGVIGYEQIAVVCRNMYACASFERV